LLASSAAFTSANRIRQKFSIGWSISSSCLNLAHRRDAKFAEKFFFKKLCALCVSVVNP
jgi:hypothetical protein